MSAISTIPLLVFLVSEQAETLMRVCERVILANGGERIDVEGQPGYRVRLQAPRLISGLESARLPLVFELEPRASSRS